MAYNLGTVKTRVQRKLDNPSFDSAILTDFANDAQREIFNRYRLTFNERENTAVQSSVGATTLTGLPTDMSLPISFRIFSPVNYAQDLQYLDYEDVDRIYPNRSLIGNNPPLAWFIFNGVPELVNQADQIYTMRLKYIKTPVELINDADVPETPAEWSEVLVLGMTARAQEHDDEYQKGAALRQQMDDLVMDMNNRLRRVTGPHVMRQPRNLRRIYGRV
jgi:hypothetical protein